MTNLARACTFGLICGVWANIALGWSGIGESREHCIVKRQADAQRASVLPADAHLAALVAAHELTAIELGGAGLDPMRWGGRAAKRPAPNPIARGSDAAPISHSHKGCTS